MAEIVQIEEMRITQIRKSYLLKGCKHMHLSADDEGEIITCDDCDKQISAYWALQYFLEHYRTACNKLDQRAQKLAEIENRTLHLGAAQVVETAWRSRTMVPTCPHCSEAIFKTDGFGRSQMSVDIALRRRELRTAQAKHKPT